MFGRPKTDSEIPMITPETPDASHLKDSDTRSTPLPNQWGVHWATPLRMFTAFVVGVVCAVGNHFFYHSLVDKAAVNQQRNVRVGTALAFLSRACFAAAVGMAHRQRIWHSLRKRYISIEGIDALFTATTDPTTFIVPDMLLRARVSSLMALIVWLLPISAVIVPATLSVEYKLFGPYSHPGTSVPYINTTTATRRISDAARAQWGLTALVNLGKDSYYMYLGPSPLTRALTIGTILSQSIPNMESPCEANCTYELEFYGPSLKCELGLYEGLNFTDASLPFNGWIDGRYGIMVYYAAKVPVPENSTDGKNGLRSRLQVLSRWGLEPGKTWDHAQATQCSPYNSSYDVNITFINNLPAYTVNSVTPIQALNESSLPYGAYDDITSWPQMAVIDTLYDDILLGYVSFTGMENNIKNTLVLGTGLIKKYNTTRVFNLTYADDIIATLEEMSHNATLALFSIATDRIPVTASQSELRLVFVYSQWVLVATYAVAAVMTVVCLLVGLAALRSNGVASDVAFSRVLVTTRSSEMDELARGACLGGDPFPRDLRKRRVRFGEIGVGDGGVGHAGFGTEQAGVAALRKGVRYE